MNQTLQTVSSFAPGLLIIVVLIIVASGFKSGWIGQFITALNSLNTPWVAMIVLILGMIFDLKCKAAGMSSDSANQIIGGGLGLLTGQALQNRPGTHTSQTIEAVMPPTPPLVPAPVVEPSKEVV